MSYTENLTSKDTELREYDGRRVVMAYAKSGRRAVARIRRQRRQNCVADAAGD